MSTKFITNIVVFATTLFLSVWLIGIPPQMRLSEGNLYAVQNYGRTSADIESLLNQDIQNGQDRRMEMDSVLDRDDSFSEVSPVEFADFADAVSEYADKSASLDDTNLPQDFRAAWQAHMNEWREHADFLEKLKQPSFKKKFSAEKIAKIDGNQSHKINVTWYKVLRIAESYNAFPENPFSE